MLTVPPVATIEPTGFAPGSSQQQPNLPLGTGTIVAGPERIWDLVRPITLDGVLTYSDANSGQISLQTALGLLTLQTDAAFPQGTALSLRITPGTPPLVSFIAQGNGGQAAAPLLVETPAVLMTGATGLAVPTLQAGQLVTLTQVLGAASLPPPSQFPAPGVQEAAGAGPGTPSAAASPSEAAAPIPRGSGVEIAAPSGPAVTLAASQAAEIAAPTPPNPATQPAGSVAPTGPASVPTDRAASATSVTSAATIFPSIAAASNSATLLGAPAPTLPLPGAVTSDFTGLSPALAAQMPNIAELPASMPVSGTVPPTAASDEETSFAARIMAILPPGAAPPSLAPGLIAATVEGSTLSGQPILRTAEGSFVVQGAAAIPLGTQLLIARVDGTAAQRPAPPAPLDPVAGKEWPALAAALPALAQSHPALAEAVRLAIPQAGPLLAPVLLLFVAGLRRGDARSWLGEAPLNALRRTGHGDLASRLTSDFEKAARQSTIAVDDGWHTIPVPLLVGSELTRLQLHLRRYPPADDEEGGASTAAGPRNGVRFLIDAEPAATGPIQLDGLVRRPQTAGRPALDLILRSRTPIDPDLRSGISRIFADALSTTGLEGALVFQGGVNWIEFAQERAAAPSVLA